MKKEKKITIFIVIGILVLLVCLKYYESNNNSIDLIEDDDIYEIDADVDYDTKTDSDVDFSKYDNYDISLSNQTSDYNITKAGVYNFSGSFNYQIIVDTDENIKIVLNNVTITNDDGPAILINSAKNAYIEIVGTNTLSDGSTYDVSDEDINGCIFSKDDLILLGTGTLNINANYKDGIVSKDDLVIKSGTYNITSQDDGIRGKDSVVILDGTFYIDAEGDGIKSTNDSDEEKGYILIEGGNFNITSTLDGIQAETKLVINDGTFDIETGGGSSVSSSSGNSSWGYWGSTTTSTESAKALKAGTLVNISSGTINIDSSDDAIHSNDSVTIDSGLITISSGDDGIHADSQVVINGGNISIDKSYEGIEGNVILINDGTINVTSSDDGINVNGGNDQSAQGGRPGQNNYSDTNSNLYLKITGGTIYVDAAGDGLDSNGQIIMTGGSVYVDGPTDDGNGPIDYNDTFTMTGGILVAAGSSGMAQNVSSSSTQNSVIITFTSTQSGGTEVSIDDIISYTPSKSFRSIVISTPTLLTNKTYSIELDGETYKDFTISSVTTSVGSSQTNNRR
ncbi:MAG: carbohydrate-binding domain-containing protein [Bacilli bacterium]|nr:carbohydrate-binding domain-containing protein [Bacilli bacterium]